VLPGPETPPSESGMVVSIGGEPRGTNVDLPLDSDWGPIVTATPSSELDGFMRAWKNGLALEGTPIPLHLIG